MSSSYPSATTAAPTVGSTSPPVRSAAVSAAATNSASIGLTSVGRPSRLGERAHLGVGPEAGGGGFDRVELEGDFRACDTERARVGDDELMVVLHLVHVWVAVTVGSMTVVTSRETGCETNRTPTLGPGSSSGTIWSSGSSVWWSSHGVSWWSPNGASRSWAAQR